MLSERALDRRLKRHLMKDRQAYFVPCAPGFEDVLEAEVRALAGAEDVASEHGGVSFEGHLDLMYHANLRIETGQRVLLRVGTYLAQSFAMLYDHLRRIHWELYLGFRPHWSVRVSTAESKLNVAARIEETLADGIRARVEELGLDPTPSTNAPIGIHLRLYRDRCTVSIDTSGAHLHKRGVRTHVGDAPLRETLAAACLRAAGTAEAELVVDPFCGSGALVVEATRMLGGIPAGAARGFAFEAFPFFQRSKWERFRAEALEAATPTPGARVLASDLDGHALHALRENLGHLGVDVPVDVAQEDALLRSYPDAQPGQRMLVATNLPYGKRVLSPPEARELSERFAAMLAARTPGYEVAVITQHPEAFERPPFEVLRRTSFRNGGLRVVFVHARVARTQ